MPKLLTAGNTSGTVKRASVLVLQAMRNCSSFLMREYHLSEDCLWVYGVIWNKLYFKIQVVITHDLDSIVSCSTSRCW